MIETEQIDDIKLFADISVDYHVDEYEDDLTEITSVKWGDVEILPLLSANQIEDIEQIIISYRLDRLYRTW
jgi:hypothetical protein